MKFPGKQRIFAEQKASFYYTAESLQYEVFFPILCLTSIYNIYNIRKLAIVIKN